MFDKTHKFLPLNAALFPEQVNDQDNPEDNACPSDVVTVKTGLGRMGLYDVPEENIDHVPDDKMYRGISVLQDLHNLPKTGELTPGDDRRWPAACAPRARACSSTIPGNGTAIGSTRTGIPGTATG
jgi:hypothetical protein